MSVQDTKLRIGVVGLGRFIEIAHMPTYFDSPYSEFIEVAAVCDTDPGRLKEWADRYGIAGRYTDTAQMVQDTPLDAVVVVTPDHAHAAPTLAALEAGCDVLVEKPMAMTVTDCDRMIQAAADQGRRLIVDFHKQFDPAHQEARERISSGRYGPLQFGRAWMQDAISVPAGDFFKSDLAAHSSPVWFLGVHFFDVIHFVTGVRPARVRATGYRHVLGPLRGIDTWDAVKADVVYTAGQSISFLVSWNLPAGIPSLTQQGFVLQFAHGEVRVDAAFSGLTDSSDVDGFKALNPAFTRRGQHGYAGYGHESIGEALREFLKLKRSGRAELAALEAQNPSGYDGLYATWIGQCVDASLADGVERDAGRAVVGRDVDCEALLRDQLGPRAEEYLQ